MGILYLAALLVALTGMVVLDRRFRLFFWKDALRATIVLVAGLAFFLIWDLQGIRLGIFFRGETSFMTGAQWAPELPLEEPFFLLLLCYLAMNLYGICVSVVGRAGLPKAARIETGERTGPDTPEPSARATRPTKEPEGTP